MRARPPCGARSAPGSPEAAADSRVGKTVRMVTNTEVGIGEFSKMSYLSIKALRHYHDVGLLEPSGVDPATGYRRYTTSQVPVAHVIRRLRDLEMPIDEIRLVLTASTPAVGNRALLRHLERMQDQLEQTQQHVASLHSLLGGELDAAGRVEIRRLAGVSVVAEAAIVPFDECDLWLDGSLQRLHHQAEAARMTVAGPDGALYADEFFADAVGEVTAFVPVADAPQASAGVGRSSADGTVLQLAPTTVALLVHHGPLEDIDRTYGALGSIVAERGIGGRGPIREHYLSDTSTEVCWPVAATSEGDATGLVIG